MTKKEFGAGIEGLRAATRPIIIYLLLLGAFFFITDGIEGQYVDWWIKLAIAASGEWVLERPITKIVKGLKK